MYTVMRYTQNQVEEIESAVTLLAESNQWGSFIGSDKYTKRLDELTKAGLLGCARVYLRFVKVGKLPSHLVRVAIEARKDYLDSLGNEPGFPAKPQLTNPVTSS